MTHGRGWGMGTMTDLACSDQGQSWTAFFFFFFNLISVFTSNNFLLRQDPKANSEPMNNQNLSKSLS